jgi:hypothetical protein
MFSTFQKTLSRLEFTPIEDELKLIVLKLDCYNLQIGCINYFKFLRQTFRYKDQIDTHTGRFKLYKQGPVNESPEKIKMRAI